MNLEAALKKIEELETVLFKNKKPVDIAFDTICRYYETDLRLRRKRTSEVEGRFIFFKWCRTFTTMSLSAIGDYVSIDHSSVIHGLKTADDRMLYEPHFRNTVDEIYQQIYNNIKLYNERTIK